MLCISPSFGFCAQTPHKFTILSTQNLQRIRLFICFLHLFDPYLYWQNIWSIIKILSDFFFSAFILSKTLSQWPTLRPRRSLALCINTANKCSYLCNWTHRQSIQPCTHTPALRQLVCTLHSYGMGVHYVCTHQHLKNTMK